MRQGGNDSADLTGHCGDYTNSHTSVPRTQEVLNECQVLALPAPHPQTNALTVLVVPSAGEDAGSRDSPRLLVEPQGHSPFGEPWQSRES